jgi:hypothetical protein
MVASTLRKTTIMEDQNIMALFIGLDFDLFWKRPRKISCFEEEMNLESYKQGFNPQSQFQQM